MNETGDTPRNLTDTQTPIHEEDSCYFVAEKITEVTTLHPYLIYFLASLCIVRLIQIIIDFKQLRRFKEEVADSSIQEFFDQKEFLDSQKFQHAKQKFKITHKIFDLCFDLVFWLLFLQVWIWDFVNGIMSTFGLCSDSSLRNDMTQGYLFAVCILLMNLVITLPFSLYFTFVIEEREDSEVKKS